MEACEKSSMVPTQESGSGVLQQLINDPQMRTAPVMVNDADQFLNLIAGQVIIKLMIKITIAYPNQGGRLYTDYYLTAAY